MCHPERSHPVILSEVEGSKNADFPIYIQSIKFGNSETAVKRSLDKLGMTNRVILRWSRIPAKNDTMSSRFIQIQKPSGFPITPNS